MNPFFFLSPIPLIYVLVKLGEMGGEKKELFVRKHKQVYFVLVGKSRRFLPSYDVALERDAPSMTPKKISHSKEQSDLRKRTKKGGEGGENCDMA